MTQKWVQGSGILGWEVLNFMGGGGGGTYEIIKS